MFCYQPCLSPCDADCLDALWKVGRADKVLLWNKCSRAQGLQLEKASGEAALGEWFCAVPLGRICRGRSLCSVWGNLSSNQRWGKKVWPHSSLCFSEIKNCESPKDPVSSASPSHVGRLAVGNLSCSLQGSDCEVSARLHSWWGQ